MSRLSDPHAADVLFAFAGGASTLSGSRIDLDKGTDVGWAPDPIKLSSILRAMRFRMELSTFPTAKKCLDRLAALAWPRTVALPQETPRLDTIEYREFPSFAAYYQAEIQPWLGKWQDLCEVYARYQKGEITEQQGTEEIQARLGKHGGDRRSEQARKDQVNHGSLAQTPTAKLPRKERTLRRLRRDDPALATRVERGELTANAAAVAKGWRKKKPEPDLYEQLCRRWDRA